jgi:hypothetical protein
METVLLAVDTVCTLIFSAAAVLAAFKSQRDLRLARFLVIIGAMLMAVRWATWGFTTEVPWLMRGAVGALIGASLFVLLPGVLHWLSDRLTAEQTKAKSGSQAPADVRAQGGQGGGGEIFGNRGTIIGGKGGNVGPGGEGRGGDGGGGVIHGDDGAIIGGEGGSVDGINIWFPPAQSGFIQCLESQGGTPDFGVQYPGAGGATGGWLQRQQVVVKIRQDYFKKTEQEAKTQSSKIEDVPLEYINERLKEAGYPWRARIEKKYWYLYYAP